MQFLIIGRLSHCQRDSSKQARRKVRGAGLEGAGRVEQSTFEGYLYAPLETKASAEPPTSCKKVMLRETHLQNAEPRAGFGFVALSGFSMVSPSFSDGCPVFFPQVMLEFAYGFLRCSYNFA